MAQGSDAMVALGNMESVVSKRDLALLRLGHIIDRSNDVGAEASIRMG